MDDDSPRLSIREAAALLHTSAPTVRKLIVEGALRGVVATGGPNGRRVYSTSSAAIEEFIRAHGTYPRARSRGESRLNRLERVVAGLDAAKIGLAASRTTAPELREVIRAQTDAIEKLNVALAAQDEAIQHLRIAEEARGRAAIATREAHEAQRAIVALYGIPDDISGLSAD